LPTKIVVRSLYERVDEVAEALRVRGRVDRRVQIVHREPDRRERRALGDRGGELLALRL